MKWRLGWAGGVVLAAAMAGAQEPKLQVAFTFDDLPSHGPMPKGETRQHIVGAMLEAFRQEKMPPIYGFVNGFRSAQYPYQEKILRAWVAAGNPLASHTFSHPELDKSSVKAYEKDIRDNEPLLKRVAGSGDWHWFRFPYLEEGDTNAKHAAIREYLDQHGYRVAEITMDFQDYQWNDVYARCAAKKDEAALESLPKSYLAAADASIGYARKLSQALYQRDIPYVLLMHVGAFDAKMVPELIKLFRERGFEFITLEQAQSDAAYAEDPGIGYPGGGLLTEMVAAKRKVNVEPPHDPAKELEALCK